MPANERDRVVFRQPQTLEERAAIAKACLESMKLTMPCVLDDMENATEKAYGGWPDRICIVDLGGRVAYYSAPGPRGFRPKEAEMALEGLLANGASPR